ncbi:MAG: hypothetical protein WBN75_09985, partial [Verrucomicrobiia bacterium]
RLPVRIIVVSVDDGLWFQFHPHLIKDGDPFHLFSNPVLDTSGSPRDFRPPIQHNAEGNV